MDYSVKEYFELINSIDFEAKRLNWHIDRLNDYVLNTYGKRTRYFLTDSELLELSQYLKKQSSRKIILRKAGLSLWKKQSFKIMNYRQ